MSDCGWVSVWLNLQSSIPKLVDLLLQELDLTVQITVTAIDVWHNTYVLFMQQAPLLQLIPKTEKHIFRKMSHSLSKMHVDAENNGAALNI